MKRQWSCFYWFWQAPHWTERTESRAGRREKVGGQTVMSVGSDYWKEGCVLMVIGGGEGKVSGWTGAKSQWEIVGAGEIRRDTCTSCVWTDHMKLMKLCLCCTFRFTLSPPAISKNDYIFMTWYSKCTVYLCRDPFTPHTKSLSPGNFYFSCRPGGYKRQIKPNTQLMLVLHRKHIPAAHLCLVWGK